MFYLFTFGLFLIVVDILFLYRNNSVRNLHLKIINEVFSEKNEEMWKQKMEEYKSISYEKMLYKFWKKLDSFYPTLGKKL